MRLLGILVCLTASVGMAGEYAVLGSGSRMHVDRHETDGSKVRLFIDGGSIEMDATQVRGFEADEHIPTPPDPKPAAAAVELGTPAKPAPTPVELAEAAAEKYGLDPKLVRSLMAAESGFQPNAVSPKGAIGLMQLMPETAKILGVDPNDPAQNVDAGTRLLRDLLVKYDGKLWHALAAYNAGEGAVEKYNGVPPYRETIDYIARIERKRKAN
ncbi:MAG TPA: lytic transglycosylase domain-containing protein [Bryobacteraceae bacterium]